uniref:Erythrocyte membrane protein band 4.1 like 4A n=1 Tax=Oncorhynchus kisutch TaxID=8019 RepID=A0A8C7CJN5_ONCKI
MSFECLLCVFCLQYWLDPSKTLSEHKDLITSKYLFLSLYQFFLQVKQDVLQGRIPCPLDISAQLAALAIQSELGDYDPYKHVSGYVSEYRFVPDQKEELEHAIEMIHKTVMGQVPSKAEHNYLGIAKTLDMYGVDLHPVFGENQSEYFLGLTPIGVVVYKNKTQVGKYFWPRITKVHFKETQFELQVVGKDCTETSFFFKAPNKTACKHLWKCCIEHHTFFRMPENDGNTLTRKLSKFGSLGSKHRYSGKTAMQMGRDLSVGLPRPDLSYTNNIPSNLFDPGQLLTSFYSPLPTRRSRSRGNTSSGSESETSTREHRKKRNRSRQENEMVDSGPQWEAVLCRQKEKSQNDPNHRRSRHRSRSRSPDVQAKEQLWKHIHALLEISRTQGDPIKIRHSHSPRSFHQYRRSQCSEGERSVLSEVNTRTDLVPPLPVTRTADIPGSSSTPSQVSHKPFSCRLLVNATRTSCDKGCEAEMFSMNKSDTLRAHSRVIISFEWQCYTY